MDAECRVLRGAAACADELQAGVWGSADCRAGMKEKSDDGEEDGYRRTHVCSDEGETREGSNCREIRNEKSGLAFNRHGPE